MLIKLIEFLRIFGVGLAYYLGYQAGFARETYDPMAQLHLMIPLVVLFVAGTSGFEGLFLGKQAAEAKGYETGSNYQKQSAFALIALTVTALIVWFLNWGIHAELTVFIMFLLFFILSAANHTKEAIQKHNFKFQNINRPFLVLMLLAGFAYPLIKVWPLL
jgi:hypothetical protein